MIQPGKKYMLVASKPSSSDYCMGCLMESYSSDSLLHTNLSHDDLIKEIALLKSEKMGSGEADWIILGIFETPGELGCDERNVIDALADNLTEQFIANRKEIEKVEIDLKKVEQKAKIEAKERREFERLQVKFGSKK